MANQTINLNFTPQNFQPCLYFSQDDVGRVFQINLQGIEVPSGATVTIRATKPSGLGFTVEADSVADNIATFTTVATMTNEHGRFPAEIHISSGSVEVGTANFLMVGEKNPHPDTTVDGDAEQVIPQLTLLVERVETAASSVLDMEVEAQTLPAGSAATYSYDEEENKVTFGIPEGQAGSGAVGTVASAYSATKTYAVGDYAIQNGNLYRCTTAITTAESFTAAHWTQVVLGDDVTQLKSALGVKSSLGRPTDLNTVTARGVYNLYNQTATNGYTNVPSIWAVGTGAVLIVDTGNATGVVWQIFIDTVGNISTRRYANSAWASWNNPNADLETTVEVVKDGFYPIGNLIANSYADGFDSGAFKSYNGFSRTDYIPCDGFDSLYFDGYATNIQNYCCFYDSNKAFISTFASRSKQGGNVSIPKTASYVVVSAQTATMQTVKASFRFLRARKDVNGGNWIFIGDSYLDGYTPDGGVDSWGVKLASFMGLDSDKYVISAKGGAGFYSQSDGINFKALLEGVTAFEKDSVTNIVVCGGYNDNTQTAANIYNAVVTFLTKAKELYPSALVSIGMVGYNSASPGIRNNLRYNSLYTYQEAVGNAPNARYLPLVEYALNNSLMSSDGVHPNANGQVQIAIAVKNALMGSAGLFYYKRLPQMITITGTTSANGEIAIAGTVASQNVLSARYTTGSGFALYRNDGYVVCFDENMQPKANTSVSIEVTYM